MKTLAIVIGNDEYFKGAQLDYAVKDANDITTAKKKQFQQNEQAAFINL